MSRGSRTEPFGRAGFHGRIGRAVWPKSRVEACAMQRLRGGDVTGAAAIRTTSSGHPFERLAVKMTRGAKRRRARVSEARQFLSECRRDFPTNGPGHNLSSVRVEP